MNPAATRKMIRTPLKYERANFLDPKIESQQQKVNGHVINFTNLNKIFWPKDKITKRDLINYYHQVASYILPYLKDRPQSLNRYPNGISGKSFYQKDVTGKVPDWVSKYGYHSSDEPRVNKNFLVPQSEADLLLMANMGCIEMHPWSSRVQSPENPDWCLIDLDPDKQPFDLVIEAALVTRKVLLAAGINSHCKTSGSTGLHIYIPLAAKYTYEESKEFAREVVTLVNKEIPAYTTIQRTISRRKGKLYLDFLQNRPQATLAAPYSVRPKPGAPVSMPLHWDELKPGLKVTDFNIFNAVGRIREHGDLFSPVLGRGVELKKIN
jgi:bifunctional non-homologous end joining protein LigD